MSTLSSIKSPILSKTQEFRLLREDYNPIWMCDLPRKEITFWTAHKSLKSRAKI